MTIQGIVIAALSVSAAAYFYGQFPTPYSYVAVGAFSLFGTCAALFTRSSARKAIVKLKGLSWSREDFCRGWLITGDTGSGKTRSGINQLMFQVFTNEPNWGGLCIDDKGLYYETLKEMCRHFGRENDLILLQIRPDGAPPNWKLEHRYNLTGDRNLPFTTYSRAVVDTASSFSTSDKGFFKNQADGHIAKALEALSEISAEPGKCTATLKNVNSVLTSETDLNDLLSALRELPTNEKRQELIAYFEEQYLKQAPEQRSGVVQTIANYLRSFLTPDIAQVFSSPEPNTFELSDIDKGKIICVSMPQKYQTERRYINTFLKLLFYGHCLRRFDRTEAERAKDNLLILWADEAQRFITANEEGMSDYNNIDVIREARATIVAASQSTTSFVPPLGKDKAKVFTLNLRNRMIFKAADEEGALDSADFLGKREVWKRSYGMSAGRSSYNRSKVEEHRFKTHELRAMKNHECVLVHCQEGPRKCVLPPLEPNGQISKWFRR